MKVVGMVDLNSSGIYEIVNLKNGKRYVGSSIRILKRWRKHLWDLEREVHHSQHLQRAWKVYGAENFRFSLFCLVPEEHLIEAEQLLIDMLRPEYNMRKEAGSSLGHRHTEETRNRMSESRKGRIFSEETRAKIGDALRGKNKSQEAKEKVSRAKRGRSITEEHRRKIGDALRGRIGRPQSAESRSKIGEAKRGRTGWKQTPETIAKMLATRAAKKATQKKEAMV